MTYPLKIQMALTQACIDMNNANNIHDIDHLIELPDLLERNGHTSPAWLKIWMKLLEDDPLLNAEEHFNKPQLKIPALCDMSHSSYMNKSNAEIKKVDAAISSICCEPNSAMRNALYVIAAQILSDSIENNPLADTWHRGTDEMQSLSNRDNYALFVKMLEREIEFWQDSVRSRGKTPPKLQHQPASKSMYM